MERLKELAAWLFETVMKWWKELATSLFVIFATIFREVLAAWLKGFFNQFLPSPQRVWLGIKNFFKTKFKTKSPAPRKRVSFRVVLAGG